MEFSYIKLRRYETSTVFYAQSKLEGKKRKKDELEDGISGDVDDGDEEER